MTGLRDHRVVEFPARPADTHPDTLAWMATIERLRMADGIDGRQDQWRTFETPLPPMTLVTTQKLRALCLWCSTPMTKQNIWRGYRCCSRTCAQRAAQVRRRAS